MKPLHLQISGLNSFRDQVSIDFNRLLIGGLFGIFGPTGSGKSTILDAMTLALYGKVRRAPGGMQGIINVREPKCAVTFTFEIGTNGYRQRYTIDRVLGRNKAGGIETKRMRLLRYDDERPIPIAEKKQEIKERINEIIGINADDFLRAVVLPQGSFAEFLGLEAKERGAVLQRLFGLYDLGDHLSRLLREHAADLSSARAEMEGKLHHLRAYDDDALALAEEVLHQATEQQSAARARLVQAEQQYRDGVRLREQLDEYQRLLVVEKERAADAQGVPEMRERITRAEQSRAIMPAIDAYNRARQRYQDAELRHADTVREKDAVEQRLTPARERYMDASQRHSSRYELLTSELEILGLVKETEATLTASRSRLESVTAEHTDAVARCLGAAEKRDQAAAALHQMEHEHAAAEHELSAQSISSEERRLLNELSLALRELHRGDEEIVRKKSEMAELSEECLLATEAVRGASEREHATSYAVQQTLAACDTIRAALHEAQDGRSMLRKLYYDLIGYQSRLEGLEQNEIRINAALKEEEGKGADTQKALAELKRQLSEATSCETMICRERDAVAALREEARQSYALTLLSRHLHDDDACPLCGSTEHPAPYAGDQGAAELAELDRESLRLENKMGEAQQRVRETEQSVASARTALESAELAVERARGELQSNRVAVTALLHEIEVEPPVQDVEQFRDRLASVREQGLMATETIEQMTAQLSIREKELADAQAQARAAGEVRMGAEADLASRQNLLHNLQERLEQLTRQIAAEREALTLRLGDRSFEDLQGELLMLHHRDQRADELRSGIDAGRKRLQEAREMLGRFERELRDHEGVRDRTDGEQRSLQAAIDRMQGERDEKLASIVTESERGRSVEWLMESRRAERSRVQQEFDEARRLYDEAVTAGVAMRERVDTLWKDLCREELARDEAERTCYGLMQEAGFAAIADVEASALPAGELEVLRARSDRATAELEEVRRCLVDARRNIGGRDISAEEIRELEDGVQVSREADEAGMKALGGAQERLRECREKHVEWNRVRMQDSLGAEHAATADQLMKYLRGNGFVDFLANERLVEICRHATVQLRSLTGGRLEIGTRPNDGFYIRDNGNGGTERSPSSLSGGETFLVSLSLALALSETIQLGRSPLEFFFLDEGFGTLDNDLLDTVMSSLERLRSEHRAIGVISHVAQLRERIPRRLIVSPASERNGSTVRYEVA